MASSFLSLDTPHMLHMLDLGECREHRHAKRLSSTLCSGRTSLWRT